MGSFPGRARGTVVQQCDSRAPDSPQSIQQAPGSTKAGHQLPTRLTILHFNDVYNVEPRAKDPVGGLARFVTRIRELKEESTARGEEEAVVLFSGDAFAPSITSTTTFGKHMVTALNEIGINTACYGNHDFDFGVEDLVSLASQNNFPWLISNVIDKTTQRPLAEGVATRVLDFHGRKIGLFGLVEREWLVTLSTLSPEEVDYEDFCDCARRLAKSLREQEGAELIIALTHMRVPNDELLAHQVPEVDLILGGHDHHYDVKPVGPHGTWVLKSGTDFRDITVLRLEFTEKADNGKSFRVLGTQHVEVVSSIQEDPRVKLFVDECIATVGASMDTVIGQTDVELDSCFASIRTQETNMGNFVADAMRARVKTDVAVINSGTIRADAMIEKGLLRMRDIVSLLPMLDELCILELSGLQILIVLENSVSQYPRLEGRFAQVSGMSFTFDAAKPPGERVLQESVLVNGEPLDPDKLYSLCTKDYLRQGKDGYDIFKQVPCLADGEQTGILQNVVREHIEALAIPEPEPDGCESPSSRRSRSKRKAHTDSELARSGADSVQLGAIAPQVEGRIVCLNAVA